jgi:hypothetical protein
MTKIIKKIHTSDRKEVCNLSGDIYVITGDGHPAGDYQSGTKVRLISGVNGNSTPGWHYNPEYATVCRIDSDHAEFLGFKRTQLKLLWTEQELLELQSMLEQIYRIN